MRVLDLSRILSEMAVVPAEPLGFKATWAGEPHLFGFGATPDKARWNLIEQVNVRFADLSECCSSEPVVEEE